MDSLCIVNCKIILAPCQKASGTLALMGYNAFASILRAMGNSRTPLIAMVIASVLNVGLDLLFVLVFHWGIAGAAGATNRSKRKLISRRRTLSGADGDARKSKAGAKLPLFDFDAVR